MIRAVILAVAIAMPAPVMAWQEAPPPPPELIGDYFPGPWAFFFAEGGTRLSPAPNPSLRSIADMAQRLPSVGIELCATDAIGAPALKETTQRRLAMVTASIRRAGVKHVVFGTKASCASEQPRDVPTVIARPHPGAFASLTGVAIYSPPVRLGGRGSMIFLPPPSLPSAAVKRTSLEAPDQLPKRATSEWLQGTWLLSATPDDLSRIACNSGTTMTYKADGTTAFFEGRGHWRLAGDRLTETLVEVFESGDPEDVRDVGKPYTTQIRRVGPHEGAMRSGDGWQPILRCRPGDIK